MGSDCSKMGVSAMSAVSGIEKDELKKLRTQFQNFIENSGEHSVVTRADFDVGLKVLEHLDVSDTEILERLFILLDEAGECKIDYKLFLVGVTLLISGTAREKLQFAFEIYDEQGTGDVSQMDMRKIFTAINSVASFFGDPVLAAGQVKDMSIDICKANNSQTVCYADNLDNIMNHPSVNIFINGKGTVRFGR